MGKLTEITLADLSPLERKLWYAAMRSKKVEATKCPTCGKSLGAWEAYCSLGCFRLRLKAIQQNLGNGIGRRKD